MKKKFVLILSPKKARWLYYFLGMLPFAIARQMRQELGGLLGITPPEQPHPPLKNRLNGARPAPFQKNGRIK